MDNGNLYNSLSKEQLNAAKNGNKDALLKNLSQSDKKKLYSLLSDEKALEEVLKSPQAKSIMKLLGKK